MDEIVWKLTSGTKKLIKEIDDLINSTKEELTNGSLLVKSDEQILSEYKVNLGRILAFQEIKSRITYSEEEVKDE